ncbi:MAG: DMT family transporter [Tissierellia bacterium]|nr:DMT family transporter [Tissierellia bacterium]MDD4725923.1 DMT family transporter [Tissierellia bacterium]
MKHIRGEIFLTLTAIIWGTSFVSQKLGMDYVEPFTFGASRFLIGALVLIPIIIYLDGRNKKDDNREKSNTNYNKRDLNISGLICGVALFLGASLQQIGLVYTTAGKSAFLTTLYILLIPVFSIFMKKKLNIQIWISVILATIGLYFLSINEDFTMGKGDAIVLVSTVFWTIQIIAVGKYASKVDSLKLSVFQFLVAGILSTICAFIFENPNLRTIIDCAGPILYTAIMVVGVAYTFQIIGQKTTPPTTASIIMSTESLFAAISGALFLNEIMSLRELFGSSLMFAAVILTQIKFPVRKKIEVKEINEL